MGTIVVGNSTALLKHEFGSEIDSFDTVIRINKAKTGGYEKNVGTKFDIWVTSDTFKVPKTFKSVYWTAVPHTSWKIFQYLNGSGIMPTIIPHGHRFKAAKKLLNADKRQRLQLTTGIAFLLWAAENLEEKLTVIGFDGYSDDSKYAAYYTKAEKGTRYDNCKEIHCAILNKLEEQNKITWRKL